MFLRVNRQRVYAGSGQTAVNRAPARSSIHTLEDPYGSSRVDLSRRPWINLEYVYPAGCQTGICRAPARAPIHALVDTIPLSSRVKR